MAISTKTILATVLINMAAFTLAGCSGFVKPPRGAPTMAQVYKAGNAGQTTFYNAKDEYSDGINDMSSATRTRLPRMVPSNQSVSSGDQVVNTLDSQFPTLPNPKSLIYIFGHYAGSSQLPVPGKFVTFSLYNQTYYALPGEVNTPYNDGQFVR